MSDRPLEPQNILQVADGVQIAFVERSGIESKLKARVRGIETIFFFALFFLALVPVQLLSFAGVPGMRALTGVLIVVFLPVAFVVFLLRSFQISMRATGVAATDVPQRLVWVGLRDTALRENELADRVFEPEIFSVWFIGQPSKWFIGTAAVFAILIGGTLWGLQVLVHLFNIGPGVEQFGFAAGFLIAMILFPTYYRVSPGRLELLQFSNLFGRRCERTVFDLRSGRVIIDLKQGVIYIGDREALFRWMPGRNRLAYYVLLAAISTHVAPELPEDQLVG